MQIIGQIAFFSLAVLAFFAVIYAVFCAVTLVPITPKPECRGCKRLPQGCLGRFGGKCMGDADKDAEA